MRTKIEYIINRDDNNKVIYRYAEITIRAKTEKQEEELFYNLREYLLSNTNFDELFFCWHDKEGLTSNCKICDREEMEELKEYYREWKKEIKNQLIKS